MAQGTILRQADWAGLVNPDKTGIYPPWVPPHPEIVTHAQHSLPDDLQLQFGQPHADAAMDAETERQMGARPGAVDDELVRVLDRLFVAVARDVPHHHAVALADGLAAEFGIDQCGAPHM